MNKDDYIEYIKQHIDEVEDIKVIRLIFALIIKNKK